MIKPGDVLRTRWLVHGSPSLPADTNVSVQQVIHFSKAGRVTKNPKSAARTRVGVEYRGQVYWLDYPDDFDQGVAENPAWASVFKANPSTKTYRGWEIRPETLTQLGYRTHEGKNFGRGRKFGGYVLRGPDGATKVVSTLAQAHAYIDQYEGVP